MTSSDITSAINYNKSQGYTDEDIRLIQEVVGAPEDGVWGPVSVRAVYEWQGRKGLTQDGKVGPKTLDLIHREQNDEPTNPDIPSNIPANKPIHGVWMDSPKSARKRDTWDELLDHGVTSVALMFEGHNERYNPYYSYDNIEKICGYAQERGMVVGITDWPYPDPEWMDDMYAHTRRMFDPNDLGFPLAFHESDVEGNWLPRRVELYANIDLAGDHLVKVKRGIVEGTDARMETTSFTSHTENGRAADVAPHMDRVFNQAYAVRNRNKRNPETGKYDLPWNIPWNHTYGPGNMVKHTLDRSLLIAGVPDEVELGCGLAAYDQKWPGHSGLEAMTVSYNMALRYRPPEIRWWSYKWLFGSVRTGYGRKFLKSVL